MTPSPSPRSRRPGAVAAPVAGGAALRRPRRRGFDHAVERAADQVAQSSAAPVRALRRWSVAELIARAVATPAAHRPLPH
jgi:hypothetical protein